MGGGRGNAARRETQSEADGVREVGSAGAEGDLESRDAQTDGGGDHAAEGQTEGDTHMPGSGARRQTPWERQWRKRRKRDTEREPREQPEAEA